MDSLFVSSHERSLLSLYLKVQPVKDAIATMRVKNRDCKIISVDMYGTSESFKEYFDTVRKIQSLGPFYQLKDAKTEEVLGWYAESEIIFDQRIGRKRSASGCCSNWR